MLHSLKETETTEAPRFNASAHAKKAFSTPAWTRSEDKKVCALYPDYNALQIALPRRSRVAIRRRVQVLNLPITVNHWTAPEATRLEKLAREGATLKQLAEAFGCNVTRIKSRLKYQRVLLARRAYRKCAHPIFDAIRQRAIEFEMTIAELDRLADTGNYFRHAGEYRPDWKKIGVALELLGGSLTIKWCEEA